MVADDKPYTKAQLEVMNNSFCHEEKKEYWDILEESASIARDRQESYGDVLENFEAAQLIALHKYNLNISKSDMCKVMLSFKGAREKHKHKDDNILDEINYLAILQYILTHENND